MLRTYARSSAIKATRAATFRPAAFQVRTMADKGPIEEATQAAGEAKGTNPKVCTHRTHPRHELADRTLRIPPLSLPAVL